MELSDLARRFTYRAPEGDQAHRYGIIRARSYALASLINEECPDSREKSLAITAIEQAVMWANAAIARNE
jgi:hypothetical protein